ncbi:uncharacterized protein LOC111351465 isoform X2 [Spodoptera litura]|uniref:Uncharacterized protein LOC111351465 isoform X2 n=1 Tax=Spodoptera litura TaxID=69820 RepID=A0A9J7DYJ0_SPOLT|nr:uncharacterized protein LOC111351465 isoform X2 [Spodoptera litura]XP_022819162.1 uncharacterized protein LOC111351465 isoform X2 [Spodoptera litura]
MPRKRKSDLSSLTNKARSMKIARAQKSSLYAELIRSNQAECHAPSRAAELPQRQQRLETRESATRRNNGMVVCPECSTNINVEDKQKEKTNAVLVNAYQYFANECPELTRAQLRQRTAQCTGANEADVECALRIHWSQNAESSDTPYGPPHKRRRVQNQHPGEESETLYVEVEVQPGEYDEDSEEDPLSSEDEDIKPDVTETCIQQTTFIASEDIKKETVESEDGVS